MNYLDMRNNEELNQIAEQTAKEVSKFISLGSEEELWTTVALIENMFSSHFGYQLWIEHGKLKAKHFSS